MAEVMGEIVCGNCSTEVPLKKDAKGKFYYHCPCGQHFMRGPKGADVVLEKAKIYGVGKSAPVNVTEETVAQPVKRNGPTPPPKPVNVTEEPVKQSVNVTEEPEPSSNSTFFR